MAQPDIPQIALPVRFAGGRLATVEQDTPDHIAQCVETVLRYERGDRETLPDFGRNELAFRRGGPSADQITAAVERWEPDAVTLTTVELDQLAANVEIKVATR